MREELIELGFKEIPHFTIGNSIYYELSRDRQLSISGLGTGNEYIFLMQFENKGDLRPSDLVCVHNFDYDGLVTIGKIKTLIEVL